MDKKKTYIFEDVISNESFIALQEALCTNEYDIVLLTSEGGDPGMEQFFKKLLADYNIKLIAYYFINSAALNLFISYEGPKEVNAYFHSATAHLTTAHPSMREVRDKSSADFAQKEMVETIHGKEIKEFTEYLTDDEMIDFIGGRDVVLSRDRLLEIISK